MTDLRDRLSDAERDRDEIEKIAARYRKFAPYKGAQKASYLEWADILDDIASSIKGAHQSLRNEIADEDMSRDHEERAELRRAYHRSVL